MSESPLYNKLIIAATDQDARLFRNNVGLATYPDGSVVRYGVCNPGGSDLIGWTVKTVTQDMVGKPVAVFTAVEGKVGKRKATPAQERFITAIQKAGGYAGVAREVADLGRIIGGF